MQRLHYLGSKFVNLRLCSVDVRTPRARSEEIVQILERIAKDIYCLQENSFGGKSVRMIGGKTAECKLLWIGN